MNKVIKSDEVDLIALRAELPRGYTSALAAKLQISKQAVSQALRGPNILHPAVQEAIKLRDMHTRELESTKKALAK
jgi:hypothetical protein